MRSAAWAFRAWRATVLAALLAALLPAALAVAPAVRAAEVEFGAPTAEARLGEPIVFRTTIDSSEMPQRVELLLSMPGEEAVTVVGAEVSGGPGDWQATATLEGHTPPNTRFSYRFRARTPEGMTLGPTAEATVVDDRFEWRTIEDEIVRLHWYEGSDDFARRALEIGEAAIDRASELLGVTETEPIDFFIYSRVDDMYAALGPGTRENVGGQAHASIRTMFGLIEPNEINSDWVDTLVAHELTHLVFDTATDNPYRAPPRWLNEGVAVYLSEGYGQGWRSTVEQAARSGSLIPLDGLGGLFPTTANEFRLAYGESVSAVDYFVTTHSEETLWQLVRSYAEGVSDDDAFRTATGDDLTAFNAAWMASLNADVPKPLGPQPAPPGPVPPGWEVEPAPTPRPGTDVPGTGEPGTGEPGAPVVTPAPTPAPPAAGGNDTGSGLASVTLTLVAVVITLLAVLPVVVLVWIYRTRRQPPPPPWG